MLIVMIINQILTLPISTDIFYTFRNVFNADKITNEGVRYSFDTRMISKADLEV